MRITIVTGPFAPLPPAGCGAVEKSWNDVGRCFADLGHCVTFISRAQGSRSGQRVTNERLRYVECMHLNRSPYMPANVAKHFFYDLSVMRVLPPAEILVTNTLWLPALAYLKPSAGKIVVNVARMPKRQMWLYLKTSRLSAVSRAVKEGIVAVCPRAEPLVKVVPNPIDTAIFTPPDAPRDYSGRKIILYAGRVHPAKGLDLLIRSVRRIYVGGSRDIHLKIVGPWGVEEGGGGKSFIRKLRTEAVGLPVELCEPIYDKMKLARVYQEAHVFCYPSVDKGETFGVAPLEAMGTGLPVVVSNLSCFKEFVVPGQNGLCFDHTSPDAERQLRRQIKKLVENPEMALSMGSSAVESACRFSIENIAKMYLEDFETLANQ